MWVSDGPQRFATLDGLGDSFRSLRVSRRNSSSSDHDQALLRSNTVDRQESIPASSHRLHSQPINFSGSAHPAHRAAYHGSNKFSGFAGQQVIAHDRSSNSIDDSAQDTDFVNPNINRNRKQMAGKGPPNPALQAPPNQQPIQKWGVTDPISIALPSSEDLLRTRELEECLAEYGGQESEEEKKRREIVLGKISKLVKEFVRQVSRNRGIPEFLAADAGGKIFTFGSYRLGVHGAGADIDTLCVAPRHVQREDFFTVMYELLKARAEVTELAAVPDSYVPVIKFSFSGIPIDLLFARLALTTVSDTLELSDNEILRNLDERCVRSLNGSRVTDAILNLVPDVSVFRTSLRVVKLWAKARAIYSNVMGFPGGVAWAMMVARVCQLYPRAAAAVVTAKFFRIMSVWKWPAPIQLKAIEDDGTLQKKVWNPRAYPSDRAHRMPVITPAYPSMCATHNVTSSTLKILNEELGRAADIADRILNGKERWKSLFEGHDFFKRYKYYLQAVASSDNMEKQLLWCGLVESKLRQLVMKLEIVENLNLAHPFIKGFDSTIETEDNSDEKEEDSEPKKRTIYQTTFYIGLQIEPKPSGSSEPRRLDITWPTREFIMLCKGWDQFEESDMGIAVKYLKSNLLPSEVFASSDKNEKGRKTEGKTRATPPSSGAEDQVASKKRKNVDTKDNILSPEAISAENGNSNPIQPGVLE